MNLLNSTTRTHILIATEGLMHDIECVNPSTAGAAYIRFFIFISTLTFKALNKFVKNIATKLSFFQFKIFINDFVGSFWIIWIPMSWVYDSYKYFCSYSAGIEFRRQILSTKVDPRAVRVRYHLLNMLKIKCDINQQYLKTVDLHFVKSE